ncbi:hypothetical protein RV134_270348 [Roseovarius sp. EC-HK134]|uniref:hypothetical protein n=1 Tax=unclassified Roseovarius TaxID=2614913 RepID=UPI0012550AE7|nr:MULTISPECIES: hypothetical protein [unclassified Roseovarius]VVT16136.1 hypothetical protein RV134_270348 [Roseovarius sp. EC-HK134]VVT16723.1 hypothetical protein RV420_330074 [Roseovarius sp. EC-SD190]
MRGVFRCTFQAIPSRAVVGFNPEPLEIGSQAGNKRDDWGYWAYGLDPDYL